MSDLPALAESRSSRPQLQWSVGWGDVEGWGTERRFPVWEISWLNPSWIKSGTCSEAKTCKREFLLLFLERPRRRLMDGGWCHHPDRASLLYQDFQGGGCHASNTRTDTHRLFSLLLNCGKPLRSKNTMRSLFIAFPIKKPVFIKWSG